MDRIEEIKILIERNSKAIDKYSIKIQEIKSELDYIDSRIKWIPASDLDEKGERRASRMANNRHNHISLGEAKKIVKEEQVLEQKKKRELVQLELENTILEKENLKKENTLLRLELDEIKNK